MIKPIKPTTETKDFCGDRVTVSKHPAFGENYLNYNGKDYFSLKDFVTEMNPTDEEIKYLNETAQLLISKP